MSRFHAETIVTRLMHECRVEPIPERDIIEFFARELLRMIGERTSLDEAASA